MMWLSALSWLAGSTSGPNTRRPSWSISNQRSTKSMIALSRSFSTQCRFTVSVIVLNAMSGVVYTAFTSFEWIIYLIGPGPKTMASLNCVTLLVTSRMYLFLSSMLCLSYLEAECPPLHVLLKFALCVARVRSGFHLYLAISTTHRDPVVATTPIVRSF